MEGTYSSSKSSKSKEVLLAILASILVGAINSTFQEFGTLPDKSIKMKYIYHVEGSFCTLICAAHCALDPCCMSAFYSESDGYCRMSYHRVHLNGQTDQEKILYKSKSTVVYKKRKLQAGRWQINRTTKKSTFELITAYLVLRRGEAVDYWIGLSGIAEEDQYVWESTGEAPNYTAWAPGAPSHFYLNMKEDCIDIYRGGWNDAPCNLERHAICELEKRALCGFA